MSFVARNASISVSGVIDRIERPNVPINTPMSTSHSALTTFHTHIILKHLRLKT